jgi:hypothetical protein
MTTKKPTSKAPRKPRSVKLVEPDSWEWSVQDGIRVLNFYSNDKIILSMPITESVSNNTSILAAELYEASNNVSQQEAVEDLDNYTLRDENTADAWTYRIPSAEGLPNHLVLLKNGKTLGVLPINVTLGQKLLLKLNHFKPVYHGKKEALEWFKQHKIISGLIIAFFAYGIFLMVVDAIEMLIPAG